MNRRSALRWLGLAPIAAPAAAATAMAAQPRVAARELTLRIGDAGAHLHLFSDGSSRCTFDGTTLTIPSLRVTQSLILPGAARSVG